ncbi:nodulation ABC transporter NodI [Streptomyces sp. SPB78]|uniref:ABC transporter ATP-binding protein n=1 Tax=Streptomyces sp. (strain SPB78) TaxID=591157 RepID=UPI0001B5540F|nr:ABC transporter ATP-binding protein [Streptomyces sp. SPB78]EFL01416.1 nodulation ABC transporter NodI [Streptomyces sp. SPB78]
MNSAKDTTRVIDVTDLRRVYGGGFEAVGGITFHVDRGELFALLGTNGAGKTSTVELLEGLARPTSGTIRVFGHDPYRERAAIRPRTGVMLQEGGFPSELTVEETVRMWAACTSGARPVGEALELVGLGKRRTVRVKQLSGGERRRLDLASALLGRPEILFLDEPTTGLDAEGRRATWDLVRALRAEGTTVLLTTHYLEEAEELADRLAILHAGRINVTGTVDEVLASQPSRISFRLPASHRPEDLPPLARLWAEPAGARADRLAPPEDAAALRAALLDADGRTVRLRTHRLQHAATELLLWARAENIELDGLDIRAASLEEAFLRIAAQAGTRTGGPSAPSPVPVPAPALALAEETTR